MNFPENFNFINKKKQKEILKKSVHFQPIGHETPIRNILTTKDNQFIVTASDDSICIWDQEHGAIKSRFECKSKQPKPPKPKYRLYAKPKSKPEPKIKTNTLKYPLAITSDNNYILIGLNLGIKVIEIANPENWFFLIAHTKKVKFLKMCPNNKYVISSSNDNTIKIWNIFERKLYWDILYKRLNIDLIEKALLYQYL